MTADELREMIGYLRRRVRLASPDERVVLFDPPTAAGMIADGLDAEGARQLEAADWWAETIEDVIETPEFCEPDDDPETVLGYARDVIQEAVWKRFSL